MAKYEAFNTGAPNFLASEVGLVLKSRTIANSGNIAVTVDGKSIIPAGTVLYDGCVVFQDAELSAETNNAIASVMVAGYVYKNKLKVGSNTLSENIVELNEYDVNRPYEEEVQFDE